MFGLASFVAPKPKSTKKMRLVCWMSDIHVPFEDKKLVAQVLQWCRDHKPDIVVLGGDILDLASCSQHGDGVLPMLAEERAAGRAFLKRVRQANPNADIVFLEGNHEFRYERFVQQKAASFEGLTSVPEMLQLKERGIKWVPYGLVHFIGKLGFTHGTLTGQNYARAHLLKYGCSLVVGHLHKLQVYTQGIAGDKCRGVFGMPCLCPTTGVPYIKGPSGWQQGFGVIHVDDQDRFWVNPIVANDGIFVYGDKVYGG